MQAFERNSEIAENAQPGFPAVPRSWYYIGAAAEIAKGPVNFSLPGNHEYVAFAPRPQQIAVLSARCSHMGADLARGCIKDGRLSCPLHGWAYAPDGKCEHIPASPNIPAFARQISYPVAQRSGHVFFFNRPRADFPLPFFPGVAHDELRPARPFDLIINTPWYLVSANGFDEQHFRSSHDRTQIGPCEVERPHPLAWRTRARFEVTGSAFMDRLTKWAAGSTVEMTIDNWGGALLLVTARFPRTTTYGFVSLVPLENNQTRVRDIVWIQRSRSALARLLLDPLKAEIRRLFIREFLRSDVTRSANIYYDPRRMIPEDRAMVEYLEWLRNLYRPNKPGFK